MAGWERESARQRREKDGQRKQKWIEEERWKERRRETEGERGGEEESHGDVAVMLFHEEIMLLCKTKTEGQLRWLFVLPSYSCVSNKKRKEKCEKLDRHE